MSSLFTQVLCIANGEILLMHRRKEPNLGLWVAAGGKVEIDEAPYECAIRELKEETGLTAKTIQLRGFVSIDMPHLKTHMIHFVYLVSDFAGDLVADEREGYLQWHSISKIYELAMPTTVRHFLPHILNEKRLFYQAKYTFDSEWKLLKTVDCDLTTRST